jgi:phosphatidylglycerol lysyltransferase
MRFPADISVFFNRHRTVIGLIIGVSLATLGFFALHRLLFTVHFKDVRTAIHALSGIQIATALCLTALSYFLLTLYDALALRIIGKPLPYKTAALASFTSYTLSHNLGLALLTGGSARYRVYSAAGLETRDILSVIATASMTFWLGVVVMAGAALAFYPSHTALGPFLVTIGAQRTFGFLILVVFGVLLGYAAGRHKSVRLFGWHLSLPSASQAIAQVAIAALDLAAASGALFILVPGVTMHGFPLFYVAYALAIIAAMISHVPGGIGVFEAVILTASPTVARPGLLAALVAYRAIYYLLPLMIAAILLAAHERRHWREPLSRALDVTQSLTAAIAPMLLAALAFMGGVVLLVSGSLPGVPYRLALLHDLLPLPFVEASHIAASLAGTGLLLLAPGLYRRLDGAFLLTRALLVAGAAFSVVKGIDFEEAIILLTIAGLLQWTRKAFYRHTVLTAEFLSPSWLIAVTTALALSLMIGFFAFKHSAFQSELWWQFAWTGDSSRFLRASFSAAIGLVGAILVLLFRPVTPKLAVQDDGLSNDLVFDECERTDAMLAFTGDKRFMRSPTGNAFLMYQVQGHSWIVMGDPVGPKDEWPDLLWTLRDRADAAQGRLLLYQISTEALPLAIDMGLHLVKYGEEARVPLAHFTLDGPEARPLRYASRRAEREGAVFEIVLATDVASLIPQLRAVSDAWLKAKGHDEKAFSVGHFDPAYLARFDLALVRAGGQIVAFANIWPTANRAEISVDLMRHVDDMPYGTMDYLFVSLMAWGRDKGYRWFTLGIAPLAGIEARRLAPIWARAGAFLYRHGDSFYGFEGLRAYKEKFSPVWEPRYIAGPSGVGLARALIDLQTLVGGGRNSAARRTALALVA